jgi:hypothetical protein
LADAVQTPFSLSLTAPTLQGRFHVRVWPVGVGVWEPDPETVLGLLLYETVSFQPETSTGSDGMQRFCGQNHVREELEALRFSVL